jgi:hypothetical protein
MKYSPITGEFCRNRKFIGDNWNKKYLRAIQCILLTTHGVVGPKRQFFEKAFGKNFNEFISILLLPEKYIIYRNHNTENGNISTYYKKVEHLNKKQKEELLKIVTTNNFENFYETELDEEVSDILNLYMTN